MKHRTHHVQRTSPFGEPFIGTCTLCGKKNLKPEAALEFCKNPFGLSSEGVLLEAIEGDRETQPDNGGIREPNQTGEEG
jgi:hypothetical protein